MLNIFPLYGAKFKKDYRRLYNTEMYIIEVLLLLKTCLTILDIDGLIRATLQRSGQDIAPGYFHLDLV